MSRTCFNYEALAPDRQATVRRCAKEINELLQRNMGMIIEIGRRLIAVRDCLEDRSFNEWLKAEFRWSQSVASNFMQVAAKFGDLDCRDRFQPSALVCLARKAVNPKAVQEAIRRARAGEIITRKQAQEMIHRHAPQGSPVALPNVSIRLRYFVRCLEKDLSDIDRRRLADEMAQIAESLRSGAGVPKGKTPRKPLERPVPKPGRPAATESTRSPRRRELATA